MNKLLSDWLLKLGVKPTELQGEERDTFDSWKAILDGEELTVEKIEEFLEVQKGEIEKRFENLDNTPRKNEKLILMHVMYSKMLKMLRSGEQERAALEKHLEQLLDTDV